MNELQADKAQQGIFTEGRADTLFHLWGIARGTGHWHTDLPLQTLVEAYRQANTLLHP
jgi:hypothetical protein